MALARVLLAALVVALSLSGCDWFEKSKKPLPGERIPVMQDRRDIEPDKDAASIQVVLPGPVANDSWPQSGGFPNYAMQHLAIGEAPQVIWSADVGVGSSSSRILTTPPVVADGKVFAKDAESTVSAYNADTGQRLWSVTLKPEKARDADEFGGGLAYYGGRLFVTTGFAAVFSLDANDGKEIWRSSVSAPVRGAPLVFGDRVFAISIDNKLHALAAVDGSDLWSFSGLRRQQPGRFGRVHRSALHIRRTGEPASGVRPHCLERVAGRPAPRGACLRQSGRYSRPTGD